VFAQTPDSTLRELPDQRTYFSKTYYNARDNTYTTRISPSYVHYLASDGTFKDIDTNLRLDKSGAYYIIDSGLYNVAFTGNFTKGNWDVAYEIPRPVKQKFHDPGKARPPVTRIRWKVLSYGYWDAQANRYRILEEANAVTPVVSGNTIDYPAIFSGIDIRYICGNVSVKEEIVLSQFGRDNLPDPARYGLSRANAYFVVAMEFLLTPANINAFARRPNGKAPIKHGNDFGFYGDDPIEFEDADSTLHFFFPKDYAYAVADSITDFSNRVSMRRYFYSDRGKDYVLVGMPWSWIASAPEGDLIIDPTTNVTTGEDVRLYDGTNYGNETRLAVGKFPNTNNYKARSLIKFDLSGVEANATILRATMNLKYYEKITFSGGTWVDRWVQAHQMLVSWSEAQATKDNRLTGTAWNATYGKIGGAVPPADDANGQFESTTFFWQNETLPVWKSWDLTALTQKWVTTFIPGLAPNYGVILWATNEDVVGYTMRFYSSEATNQSDRPYLEVVWSNTPKTVYFLKDHLGSIRATVLDSAGAPVIGYDDYDPWGYPLAGRTKAIPNAYLQGASKNKFTGKEWDDEFGVNWNYFGARYYDPQIGRWMVRDPLHNTITPIDVIGSKDFLVSPYVYALNNPVLFIDPNGEETYVDSEGNVIKDIQVWDPDDQRVFLVQSNGSMMLIGELGGEIYADIILENLLEKNIEYAEGILNPFTFRNLVKTGGDWDLKNNMETIWGLGNEKSGTIFIFNSTNMEAQDVGNLHFGTTGKATGLFPEWFMLYEAGRAQIESGTSKPEWQKGRFTPPYGDDPSDQGWIKKGFQYYKDYKKRGSK
jgi:RHS repeat-associated protein